MHESYRLADRTEARVTELLPSLRQAHELAGDVLRYLDHPGHPCTALPAWPMDGPQTPDEVVAFRRRLLKLQLALTDATCERLGPSGNRLMYHAAEFANGVMLAAHGYLNDRCAIERVDVELTKLRDYAAHITSGLARPATGQH